jgi:hypothetical protein
VGIQAESEKNIIYSPYTEKSKNGPLIIKHLRKFGCDFSEKSGFGCETWAKVAAKALGVGKFSGFLPKAATALARIFHSWIEQRSGKSVR